MQQASNNKQARMQAKKVQNNAGTWPSIATKFTKMSLIHRWSQSKKCTTNAYKNQSSYLQL